jgi:hypothetical protein
MAALCFGLFLLISWASVFVLFGKKKSSGFKHPAGRR